MNKRLAIPEIATLLSARTGKSIQESERFLLEFIQVVSQGILADKIVKIKGLGTFKILLVEDRESVHVNTGERILIPAHYKYSFVPDPDLKELVNRPFSIFETTEIGDAASFADMEESEGEEEDAEAETEAETEMAVEAQEDYVADPITNLAGELSTDLKAEEPLPEPEAPATEGVAEVLPVEEPLQPESQPGPEGYAPESISILERMVEPEAANVLGIAEASELEGLVEPEAAAILEMAPPTQTAQEPKALEATRTNDVPEVTKPKEPAELTEPEVMPEPEPEVEVTEKAPDGSLTIHPRSIEPTEVVEPAELHLKSGWSLEDGKNIHSVTGMYTTEHKKRKRRLMGIKLLKYTAVGLLLVAMAMGAYSLFYSKEVIEVLPIEMEYPLEALMEEDSLMEDSLQAGLLGGDTTLYADTAGTGAEAEPLIAEELLAKAKELNAAKTQKQEEKPKEPEAKSKELAAHAAKQKEPASPKQAVANKPAESAKASDYIDVVKIKPGNRLTVLAKKYYGNKLFWVYLYLANKDAIADPDNVPIGTTIKIPTPKRYDIDASNQASLDKAAELQTRILNEK